MAEEGGHAAWIAKSIHRHAQHGSAIHTAPPCGRGPLGPHRRCRPEHVALAMHFGRRLGRVPRETRLYTEYL